MDGQGRHFDSPGGTSDGPAAWLAARRPGYSLPGPLYTSRAAYDHDLDAIFRRDWIFACPAAALPEPGDYETLDVGPDSVIVLRDGEGDLRAFHNVCRHRGSRLCEGRGRTGMLTCPYHQWVYGLDGRLMHADHMGEGFAKGDHPLAPVHLRDVCGMVFVCLADDPPDLDEYADAVTPYLAPHQPHRTKVAHVSRIVERANWKLVIENNRECYHCAGSHPELLVSLVEFALPGDPDGGAAFEALMARKTALWDAHGLPHAPVPRNDRFRCIRLPFDHGAMSMTLDGGPACAMLLGDLTEPDLGSVRMFHVPNTWNHYLADHVLNFRILPVGPDRTELVTWWLVHEDAEEGRDYDLDRLTAVWTATNRQDGELAERNHRGIRSSAYRPGPYSQTEFLTSDFVDWYVRAASRTVPVPA